jgi:uncharacterized protein YbjT (DUF2867 family)
MTEFAIIGGTGTVGRHIVQELRSAGAAVRVLSRHSPDHPIDLATGSGLDAGLYGCGVVVDASNGSSRHPEPVLVEGARHVARAAQAAGVSHIVCVSIVGIEEVPAGYYRAKVAQERNLRDGAVPVTVVRSTQFHELVASSFAACARWGISPRLGARVQPIAAAETARAVAQVAQDADRHADGTVNVAGPEIETAGALARTWAHHEGRRLLPLHVPLPPRLGRTLRDGGLTCATPDVSGTTSFAEWLSAQS